MSERSAIRPTSAVALRTEKLFSQVRSAPPVRGSGTDWMKFGKTMSERFPPVVSPHSYFKGLDASWRRSIPATLVLHAQKDGKLDVASTTTSPVSRDERFPDADAQHPRSEDQVRTG
jgi:hypothetical protein